MKTLRMYFPLALFAMLISTALFSQNSLKIHPIDSGERWSGGSTFCSYSSRGNVFLRTSVVSSQQDTLFWASGGKLSTTRGTIVVDELNPATGSSSRLLAHECPDSMYMRGFVASPDREYFVAQYFSMLLNGPNGATYKTYLEIYHYDTLLTTAVIEFNSDAVHGLGLLVSDAGELRVIIHSLKDITVGSGATKKIKIKGGTGTVILINPRTNSINEHSINLDMKATIDKVWMNQSGEMRILLWDTQADSLNKGMSFMEAQLLGRKRYQLVGISSSYQNLWNLNLETNGLSAIRNGILCDDGSFLIGVSMMGNNKGPTYIAIDSSKFECLAGEIREMFFCVARDGKISWNVNMELDGRYLTPLGDIVSVGLGDQFVMMGYGRFVVPDPSNFQNYTDSLKLRKTMHSIDLVTVNSKSGDLMLTKICDSCSLNKVEYFYRLPSGDYAVSGTFQDNSSAYPPGQTMVRKKQRDKFVFATINVK